MSEGAEGRWDVFVSYAHEDSAVAGELARRLDAAGLRVWIDTGAAGPQLGDQLRRPINAGLGRSRFGVPILSPAYLASPWAIRELEALLAREEGGQDVVLPLLHDLDMATLRRQYPLIAARVWASTADGLGDVSTRVVDAVLAKGAGSPSEQFPTLRRRFLDLLDGEPGIDAVRAFLEHHTDILVDAAGSGGSEVRWQPDLGGVRPDVCISTLMGTAGESRWHVVVIGPPTGSLFDPAGTAVPALAAAVARAQLARQRLRRTSVSRDDWVAATVAAGRRSMAGEEKQRLAAYARGLDGVAVRTYDWLLEHA